MVNDLAYKGKRLSVIGAGVSGRSLAELAKKLVYELLVSYFIDIVLVYV